MPDFLPQLDPVLPLLQAYHARTWGHPSEVVTIPAIFALLQEAGAKVEVRRLAVRYELMPDRGRGGGTAHIYSLAVPSDNGWVLCDLRGNVGASQVVSFEALSRGILVKHLGAWEETVNWELKENPTASGSVVFERLVAEQIQTGRAMLQSIALEAGTRSTNDAPSLRPRL
jgi:hypothetical protein